MGALIQKLSAAHSNSSLSDDREGETDETQSFSCVRYWDSKTTTLLSDVLGGNSLTM